MSSIDATTPKTSEEDAFVHDVAIKLSRALNLINPNDLLARRVIDIAKTNSEPSFITGKLLYMASISLDQAIHPHSRSCLAAKGFGKFKDAFLSDIHAEVIAHAHQEPVVSTGSGPRPVLGITVHDSEVLEPEPLRQGGLMQMDMVRISITMRVGGDFSLVIAAYFQGPCKARRPTDTSCISARFGQTRGRKESSSQGRGRSK